MSVYVWKPKRTSCVQRNCVWNSATCSYKNGKYVGSIIDNSVVICNEIIKETKTIPTKSTSIKAVLTKCTSKNFYIVLGFLLNNIPLLIAAIIFCFFIKY